VPPAKHGAFWHLARLFGCTQELQALAMCAPQLSSCGCRREDDAELRTVEAPLPRDRHADCMEEEPLDQIFRHPALAAALARHPSERAGWQEAASGLAPGRTELAEANDREVSSAPRTPPTEPSQDSIEGTCLAGLRPVLPLPL